MEIEIPNPCNASWEEMTQQGNGRHCAACKKVVVDFTRMSGQDIMQYLAGATGRVCGHFRQEQIAPRKKWMLRLRRSFAIALSVLVAIARGQGQQLKKAHASSCVREAPKVRLRPVDTGDSTSTIMGLVSAPGPAPGPASPLSDSLVYLQVVDEKNNPIPFASATLRKWHQGYVADAGGFIVIPIPAREKKISLVVDAVGYVEDTFTVKKPKRGIFLPPVNNIRLRLHQAVTGGAFVTP